MLIIGIDPGISGSICFLDNGKILDVIEMPIMTDGKKNKKQVNGSQVYNEITKRINDIAKNQKNFVEVDPAKVINEGDLVSFDYKPNATVLQLHQQQLLLRIHVNCSSP